MEAKDTVSPTPDHSESVYCPHCGEEFGQESYIEAVKESQAEISFKAGQLTQKLICSQCPNAGSCLNTEGCLEEIEGGFEAVKKAGIREVAELVTSKEFYDAMVWASPHCQGTVKYVLETIYYKLKEWGVEDGG